MAESPLWWRQLLDLYLSGRVSLAKLRPISPPPDWQMIHLYSSHMEVENPGVTGLPPLRSRIFPLPWLLEKEVFCLKEWLFLGYFSLAVLLCRLWMFFLLLLEMLESESWSSFEHAPGRCEKNRSNRLEVAWQSKTLSLQALEGANVSVLTGTCKVGPGSSYNWGEITPINGVKSPQLPSYKVIYRAYNPEL